MGLNVQAYPGFKSYSVELPTSEYARSVALIMIDAGRHFYLEPSCDDHWFVTVDAEHEAFLRTIT